MNKEETLNAALTHSEIDLHRIVRIMGPVPSKDMQIPPPLRSGHIDIRDAQCPENNDGRITSYRVWAPKKSNFFKSG